MGALADDGLRVFLTVLTLLLAVSVLEVLRHPAEDPAGEAGEAGIFLYDEETAAPLPPQGRHAAPFPPGTGPGNVGPLPVRSPGRSGWAAPPGGPAHPPGPPAAGVAHRAGGPPWDPAPRPPDLDRYNRTARNRAGPR